MTIQRHNPAYRLTQNINEKALCHAGLHDMSAGSCGRRLFLFDRETVNLKKYLENPHRILIFKDYSSIQ